MKVYVKILQKQMEIVLKNIDYTLSYVDKAYWNKSVNGYTIWKQIYHTLNSIDRIFTFPENYKYPDFHVENLNSLDISSDIVIEKETLINYFEEIHSGVSLYLEGVDDNKLLEEVICQEMKLTRFDLILAQIRHITWHLGYIQSCIMHETGKLPIYIGVNKEYYPVE